MTVALATLVAGLVVGLAAWVLRGAREAPRRAAAEARCAEALAASRRRGEQAERQLQAVLEAVPHGAVLFDDEAAPGLANEAGRAFIGARHRNAVVGAAARELVLAVTGPKGSGTQGGNDGADPSAHRLVELAGSPRQAVEVVARRLADGGAAVFLEDVTERRRLEEVRRDFVANISHELRTPVGAIALLTETMAAEEEPELLLRLARRLHGEAIRVSRTIEDLLLLSRIENDAAPVREPVVVAEVLREAAERVSAAAAERRIDVRLEVPDPALRVPGDRRQLVSAVFNLADNAVKYSDPDSCVVLRASSDDAAEGGQLRLEVEDRGIGIPARDLERIFERFYRVDQARSRRTGGTGLGLSIVRHVAENHGGRITACSCEGQGSTFALSIPVERPAPDRPADPSPRTEEPAPEVA